jgi:hypothetical protein
MTNRTKSPRLLLATTALAGWLVVGGAYPAMAAETDVARPDVMIASAPTWSPQSSERLVKLPPRYLKKSLDRDFADSALGTALKQNASKIGHKGNTLADLQTSIERADGELRLELRHQFLAEKRAYLDLMASQIDFNRQQAKTRLKLFERMLDDLARKNAADTPATRELIAKQTLARERLQSSLAQVDLKVFETATVPESRYAVKYGQNVQAIEQLLARVSTHGMNQSLTAEGTEMTKAEFIRHMAVEAEAELALADQDDTILGYMAKLVALDAMALSEEAIDAELADSPLPGNAGPAMAVNFFLSN